MTRHLSIAANKRRHKPGLGFFINNASGAAAIEMAFVLPVFLAGVFAAVEFSRVMYSKIEFEYAVSNAMRYGIAMKNADTTKVKQAVSSNFILLDPAKLTSVTMTETVNPDKTRSATISASYQVDFLLPITESKSVTLSRSITFLRGQ